ncbi:MAG: hypothetical protein PHR26_00815 [Candidatus ainarchaeum sp.]|nr:hypothetical protein [Candidatus ainarchaeum sp.]MDD3976224.1 hypothetical protein [Candidatus ainarchaeum sp.]
MFFENNNITAFPNINQWGVSNVVILIYIFKNTNISTVNCQATATAWGQSFLTLGYSCKFMVLY